MEEYLELLDTDKTASWTAIEEAYQDQIRVWNPDRFLNDTGLFNRARKRYQDVERAWMKLRSIRIKIERTQGCFDVQAPMIEQYQGYRAKVKSSAVKAREVGSHPRLKDSLNEWESKASQMWDAKASAAVRRKAASKSKKRQREAIKKENLARRQRAAAAEATSSRFIRRLPLPALGVVLLLLLYETVYHQPQTAVPPLPLGAPLRPPAVEQKATVPEATESKDEGSATLIVRDGAAAYPELVTAAIDCDVERAESLLAKGAAPDAADQLQQTPLMWAAKRNCLPVIAALLAAGARRDLTSKNGYTAYRWAKFYNHSEAARLLAPR